MTLEAGGNQCHHLGRMGLEIPPGPTDTQESRVRLNLRDRDGGRVVLTPSTQVVSTTHQGCPVPVSGVSVLRDVSVTPSLYRGTTN